jgi:glycerol kinase
MKELGRSYELVVSRVDKEGVFETDADHIFDTVVSTVKTALSKSGVKAEEIAAMGITNQRSTFTSWDSKTGKSLHPFISWADLRGTEICETANNSAFTHVLRTVCRVGYWITRMPLLLTVSHLTLKNNQLGPKLCWVVKNVPQVTECLNRGDLRVGTLDSWLLFRLSGKRLHACDASNASATGVFDPFGMTWSNIVKFMVYPFRYVPISVYPKVMQSSDDFGKTDKSIFGCEIPICALAADQQAAMFGHGCSKKGDTKVTLGTGGFVNANTGEKALASYGSLYPLVAWQLNKKTVFAMEGPDTTAGLGVEWLVKVGLVQNPVETETLALSVPDSGDVFYVPALFGLGAPHWDDHARAMFIGMTASTTRAHLVRAALECYGFRVAEILRAFFEQVLPKSHHNGLLHISGGMSTNNFVCQSIADITGLTVVRPSNVETTSIGIAFLAGIQAGIWKEDDVEDFRKIDRMFPPAISDKERDKKIASWNEAVRRASKWAETAKTGGAPSKTLPSWSQLLIIIFAFITLGILFKLQPWYTIKRI